MNRKYWLLLGAFLALVVLGIVVFSSSLTTSSSSQISLSSPSPTSTIGLITLPTVTPPSPGEPTLPSRALEMQAAPTVTPGEPLPYPSSFPTPTWLPSPLQMTPSTTDDTPVVRIPASEFIMGSTEEEVDQLNRQWAEKYGKAFLYRFNNEAPQMVVYLDTYSIDQYKVTFAQYRRCVEAEVCTPPSETHPELVDALTNPQYDNYAARVTWYNANIYCQWVGKRLPSEAEWEKAARGTDGQWYPWGDKHDLTRYAHNPDTYEPVNQYLRGASPYDVVGLLDRPAEWTTDWYRAYPGNDIIYPGLDTSWRVAGKEDLYDKGYRTARGGGLPEEERARVSGRSGGNPIENHISFRCVQGPEPVPLEQAIVHATAPTSVPTPLSTTTVNLDDMVYIPAGEFIMGTDEVSPDDFYRLGEVPEHIVYLDAYYINLTEVTRQEFAGFLNVLGTHHRACGGYDCGTGGTVFDQDSDKYIVGVFDGTQGKYVEDLRYADYPAMGVTWYGAHAYCGWMGKRMPTEAEWEKAARGTDGRRYPWGNEPVELFLGEYRESVGSRPGNASPYGILDALGNVEEWVADWYDPAYYIYSPLVNPLGPVSGEDKVLRSPTTTLMQYGVTFRDHASPLASYDIGFRCAYSPDQ